MSMPVRRARARLHVSIISASHLRAADISLFGAAKSDPYCICDIPGRPDKQLKTDVIQKTLDPEWLFEGDIDEIKEGEALEFTVFDYDLLSSDDLLGKATLEWSDFFPSGFHGTVTLEEPTPKKERATLTVVVETYPAPVDDEDKPRCFVTVETAKGLRAADWGGKSDPYCVCGVPGKPLSKFRTKVVMTCVDPAWHEQDELIGFEVGDDIEFVLWDWDRNADDDELGRVTLTAEQFVPDGFGGSLALVKGRLTVKVELYIPAPPEPVDPGVAVGIEDRRPVPFQLRSLDTGRTHRLVAYTEVGRSRRHLDLRYDLCLDMPGSADISRTEHAILKTWCPSDSYKWIVRVYNCQARRNSGFGNGPGGGHAGGGTTVDNLLVEDAIGMTVEPGSVLRFGMREMWVLENASIFKKSQVGEIASLRAKANSTEDPGSFRELRVPSGACNHALQHCSDWDSLVRVVLEWCGEPDEAPCVDIIEVLDETGRGAGRHEARTVEEQETYRVSRILSEVRMGCTLRIRLSSDPCLLAPILGKLERQRKKAEDLHIIRSRALFGVVVA